GGNRDFDLELGQEAHGIFGAPIDLGVPLLPAIPFDFGDGEPVDADTGQRVADLVEFEWLDDGHDEFHGNPPLGPVHKLRPGNDWLDRGGTPPRPLHRERGIKPRANSPATSLSFWKR